MKRLLCILVSMILLLTVSCVSISLEMPGSTPQPGPGATLTPLIETPTATFDLPGPTPPPTETPASIDLTLVPPPDGAQRSLYLLYQGGLYVLRPNTSQPERLTSPDVIVTAFSVWPEDGRIAFATKSGKLYTQMPGGDPMPLIKFEDEDMPYPAYVNGIDWSPDGSQLAFTVVYDNGDGMVYAAYPSSPSGVWIMPIKGGRPRWIISNRYPATENEGLDMSEYRRFSAPQWSPDGQSLIVEAGYWEWTNTHWIYPLEYTSDDRNLHSIRLDDPSLGGIENWGHAAWTMDSQGLIFSSELNVTYGDLAYTTRDGAHAEVWQAGKLANLYIGDAHMVPDNSYLPGATMGIASGPGRMLYIGTCSNCQDPSAARIFVQRSKLVDATMNGTIVGPESLCTGKDTYGNHNWPRPIEWTPDFKQGVLTCGTNEIYLLTLNRDIPTLTDLLSMLPPITGYETPIFEWGELRP